MLTSLAFHYTLASLPAVKRNISPSGNILLIPMPAESLGEHLRCPCRCRGEAYRWPLSCPNMPACLHMLLCMR